MSSLIIFSFLLHHRNLPLNLATSSYVVYYILFISRTSLPSTPIFFLILRMALGKGNTFLFSVYPLQ